MFSLIVEKNYYNYNILRKLIKINKSKMMDLCFKINIIFRRYSVVGNFSVELCIKYRYYYILSIGTDIQ